MTFETEFGTPNVMKLVEHDTDGKARNRLVSGFEERRRFGEKHDPALREGCVEVLYQIRELDVKALPLNQWRGWSVRDNVSGVTFTGRVRRTS